MNKRLKPTQVPELAPHEALHPIVAVSRMQSEKHAVGQFLAKACDDEANETEYQRTVAKIGLVNAYVLLSAIKDPLSKIEQPARWFFWKAKSMKNVDND